MFELIFSLPTLVKFKIIVGLFALQLFPVIWYTVKFIKDFNKAENA